MDAANLNTPEAQASLAEAAVILRSGGLVAFPTETVYGLGANALDASAVARIFAAKQRPAWDPVIVHVAGPASQHMLDSLVAEIAPRVLALMTAFWPGPLTLLLPRAAAVPDAVTAGRPLVGVRMPAHPVALELIRLAGVPIAAPSANLFSHVSPTRAEHVLADLDGRIDAIVDAGPTRHGVESTVLDPNPDPMIIYRPGAITDHQIRDVAGPVTYFEERMLPKAGAPQALPSPGVGIRHYAPRARLILIEDPLDQLSEKFKRAVDEHHGKIGVLLPSDLNDALAIDPSWIIQPWGSWVRPASLAQELYAGLRSLDAAGCDFILCPLPPPTGIGAAIRDRLRKAAR